MPGSPRAQNRGTAARIPIATIATIGRAANAIRRVQTVVRSRLVATRPSVSPAGSGSTIRPTGSEVGLGSGGPSCTARSYARVAGLEDSRGVIWRSRPRRLSWHKAPPSGRFVALTLLVAVLGGVGVLPRWPGLVQ